MTSQLWIRIKAMKSVSPNLFYVENNVFNMEERKCCKNVHPVKHVWQDFFVIQQLFTTWDKKVTIKILEQHCKHLVGFQNPGLTEQMVLLIVV